MFYTGFFEGIVVVGLGLVKGLGMKVCVDCYYKKKDNNTIKTEPRNNQSLIVSLTKRPYVMIII